jgi:hypothetical protein
VVDLYECVELLFPARVNAREEVAAQYVARDLEKKGVRSKSLADASTDVMSAVMKIAHVVFDREIKLKKVCLVRSLRPLVWPKTRDGVSEVYFIGDLT